MKKLSVVGKNVRKLDSVEKAMGAATFTTDIYLPGMLYGKVLRSPYPHARIVNIDTSKAEQYPGVKAVATYKNTPRVKFNTSAAATFTVPPLQPVYDQYIFDSFVRYVGDEVAAVAAVSEKVAEEALKLIEVEYEQMPTVYDPLEAMKPEAPVLHDQCKDGKNIPGEIVRINMGDVEKGFAEADYIFEHTFKLPVQKQAQMETQAAVAQVTVDGKVTVWSTTQTPHPSRHILATVFGIPASKVRVLNPPYIGGGFGVRIGLSAKAEPIAVALAMKTKKPVKVVYNRQEDFVASDTRHSGYVTVKTGVNKDGTFTARKLTSTLNTGAYCSFGAETPGVLGAVGLSSYYCPNQEYYGHSVYTNTTPAGAMRGFGSPQAMFAIESHTDIIAKELNLEPIELRLKNMMRVGKPWVLPYACQSTGLEECITKGAAAIGWERKGKLDKSGTKKRGIGIGIGTHVSNSWPFCVDYSNAYVTVQQDGSVQLATGVPDMGTGTITSLAQMVAEVLGVSLAKVNVTFADTESTPFEIGSHASRTCYVAGMAVVAAANDVKKEMLEYAAKVLEVAVDDLEIENDTVYSISQPEKTISLKELSEKAHLGNKQFIGVGRVVPENAPPWMAHFAEVEVDTETGEIKVVKVVAAHDVGKAIHPQIVEGQLHGGLAQGIGYALSEEIKYNDKGKQLNDGFHKYLLPTAADIPEMEAIIVEAADPTHPFGVKGVGETGLVATAGAIANAVYDAVGIRFFEIPITQEKMYRALQQKSDQ
jgi:xanthine dehydrogenase molybdenum-binding subunit